MELHTLGVNGGYTQADVIQVARVLTGWEVHRPQLGGAFQFNPNRHEPGTKTVHGHKNQGQRASWKASSFSTSSPRVPPPRSSSPVSWPSVSSVTTPPSPSSTAWPAPGSHQRRHSLRPPHPLPLARVLVRIRLPRQIKTPLEFVVSAARASNADVQNYQPLVNALRQMGMPLYGCVPPTGYKWDQANWVSTSALVDRINFGAPARRQSFPGRHRRLGARRRPLRPRHRRALHADHPHSRVGRVAPRAPPHSRRRQHRHPLRRPYVFAQQNAAPPRPNVQADMSSPVGLAHDFPPSAEARPVYPTDAIARRVNPNRPNANRPNRAPAPDKY